MTKTLSLLERAAAKYDFGPAVDRPHPSSLRVSPSPDGRGPGPAPAGQRKGEGDLAANDTLDLSAIPPEFREHDESTDTPRLPPLDGPVAIDRGMLAERGMIVPGAPVGPLAEEFRLVKRQLLITAGRIGESDTPDKARSVLVCSAKPGEGKTFCSLNLALSMAAERDTEVLLIDADFAKPDVMKQLGLDDSPGLLDALADPTLDPETLVVDTDVPHLSILPAGSRMASDTELLASSRTRAVIARLLAANPRRLLIFDSPPALAASPASVLAMLVGQVMLVVRADRTPENELRDAVSLLDGCEHIALVLNAVSFVPGGARFGSYYGQEDRP